MLPSANLPGQGPEKDVDRHFRPASGLEQPETGCHVLFKQHVGRYNEPQAY